MKHLERIGKRAFNRQVDGKILAESIQSMSGLGSFPVLSTFPSLGTPGQKFWYAGTLWTFAKEGQFRNIPPGNPWPVKGYKEASFTSIVSDTTILDTVIHINDLVISGLSFVQDGGIQADFLQLIALQDINGFVNVLDATSVAPLGSALGLVLGNVEETYIPIFYETAVGREYNVSVNLKIYPPIA